MQFEISNAEINVIAMSMNSAKSAIDGVLANLQAQAQANEAAAAKQQQPTLKAVPDSSAG
ncbi:hypothetical protein UFOVP154_41 [uncultured Caudovirales phage]|uniref:Uncharacterized protein n=1 Tax=uncultured Caudovirales phage TaxID=2100421 RepID=A0A6J7W8X9_9CAUD|nr:hypothetical protein UFOVP8_26 [uncultured Caudovirales phage]CAB5170697.1 hypothetical protein UFOVP154_41 [uncultured Caudovirales phage]